MLLQAVQDQRTNRVPFVCSQFVNIDACQVHADILIDSAAHREITRIMGHTTPMVVWSTIAVVVSVIAVSCVIAVVSCCGNRNIHETWRRCHPDQLRAYVS